MSPRACGKATGSAAHNYVTPVDSLPSQMTTDILPRYGSVNPGTEPASSMHRSCSSIRRCCSKVSSVRRGCAFFSLRASSSACCFFWIITLVISRLCACIRSAWSLKCWTAKSIPVFSYKTAGSTVGRGFSWCKCCCSWYRDAVRSAKLSVPLVGSSAVGVLSAGVRCKRIGTMGGETR